MNTLPHPLFRNQWFWLAFFLAGTLAVYWPAREAGFVTDWLGGQERYETGTFSDALRSFDWVALLPVLFVTNFTLFKVFGTAWLPWFLIFTGLHALNGWQLYRLAGRLPGIGASGPNGPWIAPAVAALFLLSPYAAEPVVWKGCIQYLISLLFLLTALHQTLHFVEKPALRPALWTNGLFLAAIYLTEWNIIWPAIFVLFLLVVTYARGDWPQFGRRLGWLVLPQAAMVAGWFGLNKIYLGHWVGHYGSGTHLKLDIPAMLATEYKYLVKYPGFVRFFEHPVKERVFGWFDRPAVLWGTTAVLCLLLAAWLVLFKKINARWQWAGFGLAAFFAALLPVANLYFYFLQWSENDRYGYYASGFFWLAAVLALAGLPRRVFRPVVVGFLAVSFIFLLKMTRTWGQAEDIYASLVQDFRWYDRDEVIILASPDNLSGVSILRIIGQPCGFDEALALRRREPFKGKMWEVAQFNMETPNDGVKVEKLDTDTSGMTYKVLFPQFGNWWFRNGIGAGDYETESYIFRTREWHVETTLREKRPNRAVIYPVGGKWFEAPQ